MSTSPQDPKARGNGASLPAIDWRDRPLNIAIGATVKTNQVKNRRLNWSQMVEKLSKPTVTSETIADYLKSPRETQDEIKDVGYFVPAHYQGEIRKKENLGPKDLGTLDFDHAKPDFHEKIKALYDGLAFVLHTTHKHTAENPRFRLVFLFSRAVTDAEYPAIMRDLAARGDINECDDTTFQPSRVMHLPSRAIDGEFVFYANDGAPVDVDQVLSRYLEWQDTAEWPVSDRVKNPLRVPGNKPQDPREKTGIVGAFCRSYDIREAIDRFLPGVYLSGSAPNRLTFAGGSTSNGAVIYDDGLFLYSHHESDPCGGQKVNAFDLVRLHKFAALDANQKDVTPGRQKSFKAMVKLARTDETVQANLISDQRAEFDDFESEAPNAIDMQGLSDDPVALEFINRGMMLLQRDGYSLFTVCPWGDGHAGVARSVYWLPSTRNHGRGGFRCSDPNCKDRNVKNVREHFRLPPADQISKEKFWCYLPENKFLFELTGELWPAGAVDRRLPKVALPKKIAKKDPTEKASDGEPIRLNTDASPTVDVEPAEPAKKTKAKKGKKSKKPKTPESEKPETDEEEDKMLASVWIGLHRRVEQMVWSPADAQVIYNRIAGKEGGGWHQQSGTTCFNLYVPPVVIRGDADKAGPWLELIRTLFPDEAEHIIRWFAHRVQRPGEKLIHALVLGGKQGIGKDSVIEPVKQAIGSWNCAEVSPLMLMGQFNPYLKSVILRVSEARDLGESSRFVFYHHIKTLTTAPPDTLTCNEKNRKPYPVFNVLGVIITTNHKTDGIYLPADDRRHFVAWSERSKEEFKPDHWKTLWGWYESGGYGHVAAYLRALDLSDFNPKAPPFLTPAFHAIVGANRPAEESELADTLEKMGSPAALTLRGLIEHATTNDLRMWLSDRSNRRGIPHRLETVGYTHVRNDAAKSDGNWKVGESRQAIYARADLSPKDRFAAATELAKSDKSKPTVQSDFDDDDGL